MDSKPQRSFTTKVEDARRTSRFMRIVTKECGEQGFLIKDKVHLTTKTFESHPDYVLLPATRLIGKISNIRAFVSSQTMSQELRTVIEEELSNPITAENFNTDRTFRINDLEFHPESDKVTVKSSWTESCNSFVNAEIANSARLKQDKGDKGDKVVSLDNLPMILLYLKKDDSHLIKTKRILPSKIVVAEPKAPKENLFIKKLREAKSRGNWLNVSNFTEKGTGVATVPDKPVNAFTFDGYPDLDRCFWTPKRDNRPTSPTKNIKHVGPTNCLKHYIDHMPNIPNRTREECLREVHALVSIQSRSRDHPALTRN